jgi:hypothetical protein
MSREMNKNNIVRYHHDNALRHVEKQFKQFSEEQFAQNGLLDTICHVHIQQTSMKLTFSRVVKDGIKESSIKPQMEDVERRRTLDTCKRGF